MRAIFVSFALIVAAIDSVSAEPAVRTEIVSESAVTSIHRLDGIPALGKVSLLTHDEMSGTAIVYELADGKLVKRAETVVPDRIWAATTFASGDRPRIAYATGYGRKNLQAPIRVHLAGAKMESPEKIFELASERSEVTFVRQDGEGLLINLFESKYFTKLTLLTRAAEGAWTAAERLRLRLGTYVDSDGSHTAIGRPYGDELGQDGDAKLLSDGKLSLLPTYRGVSSVHFTQLDNDPASELLIGDGWHQDYGKLAEGRLSMLDLDERSGRYALQIVEVDDQQYAFTRIASIRPDGRLLVVAGGPERIRMFDPSSNWSSQTLYERSSEGAILDFVALGAEGGAIYLAISDGKLLLARVSGQHAE